MPIEVVGLSGAINTYRRIPVSAILYQVALLTVATPNHVICDVSYPSTTLSILAFH